MFVTNALCGRPRIGTVLPQSFEDAARILQDEKSSAYAHVV